MKSPRTCILLMAIVVVIGTILLLVRSQPRFTRTAFNQIREGMTRSQVEEILTCPAGNYASRRLFSKAAKNKYPGEDIEEWVADDSWVMVRFESDGKVIQGYYSDDVSGIVETPPTFWQRIRRLLGI